MWAEIYIEGEWVPITLKSNKYSRVEASDIEPQLSWPISYCLAFDGGIRDVTARYASEWLTETKKLRFKYIEKETNWWKDTCEIWPSRNKNLEKEENKKLQKELKAQGELDLHLIDNRFFATSRKIFILLIRESLKNHK